MALVAHRLPSPTPDLSCGSSGLRRLSFSALGTVCDVQYACDQPAVAQTFERHVVQWVQAFEAKYSRFREDSLVSRINAAAGRGWVEIDAEVEQLFKLCDTLVFLTQGIIDPTILPLMRLWNYKVPRTVLPAEAEIARARSLVGWRKVKREPGRVFLPEPGMALDFGGFGKEYAVDVVAQIAIDHGIANVLVDFGHDLRALGRPPDRPAWHIGLENPSMPGVAAGSVALTGNRGIASSGDYLRGFALGGRRYGHIVDPRTGWPVANGCMQATAIASSCLQAGVLSTTAFVLGVAKGIEFIQAAPG
ncbi:MAG TPA: FAD:protein FMN transferase, partial [Opitutus sp.]|nr:FAD:protein FMN transferase [Opitutus sp.]